MPERTIWIDMDGVLADYEGRAKTLGLDPDTAHDRPGWYRDLAVLPGAKEGIQALRQTGVKVRVLSTPPKARPEEAAAEKKAWLGEHFPELVESAVFTRDKSAFGQPGDILVDDHPEWNGAKGFKGKVIAFKGAKSWTAAVVAATHPETEVVKAEGHLPEHDPTDGQKRANNYRHAHLRLHGLDISIENLAGSTRRGKDGKGQEWSTVMPYHYGYIKKTEGADGDHLDVAIGPLPVNEEAHIINQRNPQTGAFDEHKVFLGFSSREAAIQAFRAGRSDNPDDVMINAITVPIAELKRWIADGELGEQAILKAEGGKAHVKAHYRNVDGKVVYIQDYDKTVHGDHPQATLQQRTIIKQTKHGHTIQVTDSEDNEKVKATMQALGVEPQATQHTGATHHGVKKAVFQHHFINPEHAQAVHAALGGEKVELKPGADAGPQPETQKVQRADAGPEADPIADALMGAEGFVVHVDDCENVEEAMDSIGGVLHDLYMAKNGGDAKQLDATADDVMDAFASFAIQHEAPLKAIMCDLDTPELAKHKGLFRQMVGGCRCSQDIVAVEGFFRRFIKAKGLQENSAMPAAALGSTIAEIRKMGTVEAYSKVKNVALVRKGPDLALSLSPLVSEAAAIADDKASNFLADTTKALEAFASSVTLELNEHGYIRHPNEVFITPIVAVHDKAAFHGALGHQDWQQQAIKELEGFKAARAAEQKKADYITADLESIAKQAHAEHSAAKFKLAAVISAKRAEAEEMKKGSDPEKAKNLWVAAASFATLAQQQG